MSRYFIELAYHGTAYHGWQIQKNAPTVQQELNCVLSTALRQNIETTGCGRTDTGVHASQFFAHFDHNGVLDSVQLKAKLNRMLPPDIGVFKIFQVSPGVHARFSATARTYQYFILQQKDPYYLNRSWYFHFPLDLDKMNKAAAVLKQYEDFSSFSKSRTQVKTNICSIYKAQWIRKQDVMVFTITADRFLRNMVRAIVGTLVEVGMNKLSVSGFGEIIERKSRCEAGQSVPASGLFLTGIDYPDFTSAKREIKLKQQLD